LAVMRSAALCCALLCEEGMSMTDPEAY